jgi:uncharacterized protein YjbJ (UPF0337 family)
MDEDWITGAAQKLTGSAKDAAGSALGDTKLQAEGKADKVAGTVRNTAGGAKDATRDLGDDVQGELARLRNQVSRLMDENVTPALAGAAGAAEDYARQAKGVVVEQSERASAVIQERPLLAVGIGFAAGYLVGRLMGGNTYVYPRR